jgi:hypothetical protein
VAETPEGRADHGGGSGAAPSGRKAPSYRGGPWRVPRLWDGHTAVCIASGPSLTERDVAYVRRAREQDRCRVIVVNRTWERARWADILYGADASWWRQAQNAPGFGGLKVCLEAIEFRDVHVLKAAKVDDKRAVATGLSFDPETLVTGSNSGYQAVGLAVLLGARRIGLLGYDMQYGPNGEKHWHEDHAMRNPREKQMLEWCRFFETMLPDLARASCEVVNATRRTALTCFPRVKLEDVL